MSRRALIDRLHRRLGLDRESIGTTTLDHAIDEACATLGCANAAALLTLVESSERDWQRFVDCMVVPETWLFRVPEQFSDLQRYARTELGSRRPIRILSLPCATGEEVYSIIATMLEAGFSVDSLQVVGVDVSTRLIEHARAARYSKHALRGRPVDSNWFGWEGEVLQPNPSVRRAASFRVGNALQPGLFASDERFDVIFCRNLLIYLDLDSRRQVISQLLSVLEPPGLILAGQAEVLSAIDGRLQPLSGYGPLSFSLAARPSREEAAIVAKPPRPVAKLTPTAPKRDRAPRPEPAPAAVGATLASGLAQAQLAADGGRLDEARKACAELLKAHPEAAEAWFLHGVVEAALENWDAAESAFVRVGYLDRDHRDALAHRAALAERRGRNDEAAQLRSRLKRTPGPAGA